MRNYVMILLFFSIMGTMWAASNKIVVKRANSVLRQAPGSYAPILRELPVGTTLEVLADEEPWIQVKSEDQTGYVSDQVAVAKPPRNNVFAQMSMQQTGTTVSRHGMSAGVKGFGERFNKSFKGDPSFLDLALSYQLDVKRYERFRKDTYRDLNIKKLRKQFKLPVRPDPDQFTDVESGFGLALASAIAAQGLYKNANVTEYVNDVGNLVADASDVPDVEFKFFVLNIPAANAYACPGGYIFITKGMLQSIRSEAELACVLGHEIAHVSRLHGVQEMQKRKNQIGADDAFAELDNALPDDDSELAKTAKDLDDEAFGMFEYLIQGRLEKYEKEADLLGMTFALRAGYDPRALLSLLERLMTYNVNSNNQHYTKENLKNRIEWVRDDVSGRTFPDNLLRNTDRPSLELSQLRK